MNRWTAGADAQPVNSKMIEAQPARLVLLVGSVPLGSAADVFEVVGANLGDLIRRVPDGEVGPRFGEDCLAKANHGPRYRNRDWRLPPNSARGRPSRHANPNHSDWRHYRLALRKTGALASRLYHQRYNRRSGLVHRIPSSCIGGSVELCCDYTFNRCCGRSPYHPVGLEDLSSPCKTQMNRRCTRSDYFD